MGVHFISGKPGGGKSMYAVKLIVDELAHGQRRVVTNVSLKLPELNEYLQSRYENVIDLLNRVTILNEEQTGEFWCHRGYPTGTKVLTKAQWDEGQKPDFSAVKDCGVLYVIDEVHNFFNARRWMKTGADVLFYLSQHRKLGDDVIAITQAVNNVDKQFRSVTQDYTYLRNLMKEKYGFFRLPGVFLRRTYLEPATATSVAMETGSFKLDVSGLASVYDTAVGTGIHGRFADVGARRSGFHWGWGIVAVTVLVCGVGFGAPDLVGRLFRTEVEKNRLGERSSAQSGGGKLWSGTVFDSSKKTAQGTSEVSQVKVEKEIGQKAPGTEIGAKGEKIAQARIGGEVKLKLVSSVWVKLPGKPPRLEWLLSDGHKVTPESADFVRGGPGWVELRGAGRIE